MAAPGVFWGAGYPSTTQGVQDCGYRWGYDTGDAELRFSGITGGAWSPVMSLGKTKVTMEGTAAMLPPVGTTAERPGSPETGDTRFNTTLGRTESWNGTHWRAGHQVALTSYLDKNQKFSEEHIHGAFSKIENAAALSTGVPIDVGKGTGKVVLVVNAGSDLIGDVTITGTSVDRDTGTENPADTDTLTIAGVSTDNTTADAELNVIHRVVGGYISSKWFTGTVTISTTEVDISDVDVYHISFEQWNDTDTTVETFDVSCKTSNTNAWAYWYLYSVKVAAGLVTINDFAALSIPDGTVAKADAEWRLRRGDLGEHLTGSTDGIFVGQHLGPANQTYIEDLTMKVWGCQ